MQNQQINLEEITDIAQLNELYVSCNESLGKAQAEAQQQSQNLQNVRARIAQVRQDEAKKAEAEKAAAAKAEKPAKA
jgi:hypothetical protein